MDERELKKMAEELAKVAVESGLASKQLRAIYELTRTKPLPMVEAYVQRQLGRDVSGKKAFEMILDLLKSSEDKAVFSKILWYANMVFDYYQKQYVTGCRDVAEAASKRACEMHSCKYVGLDILTDRDLQEVKVKVSGFKGDPKFLASSIWREIVGKQPNFKGRIWIDQLDRR